VLPLDDEMKGETMNKLLGIILVIVISIMPFHAAAAALDGSSPLLCAVVEVFECSLERDCSEAEVENVNIPQFIKVDLQSSKISSRDENREKRETVIKNVEHDKGMLIIQGVEDGRGWSITIAEDTGEMTGAATEDAGGFVFVGACTLD
jgi:hypothetical protein